MKILHVCPICNYLKRSSERSESYHGMTGSLLKSNSKVVHIHPAKCQNEICLQYREEKPNDPTIGEMTYKEYETSRNLTPDPKLRFLQLA